MAVSSRAERRQKAKEEKKAQKKVAKQQAKAVVGTRTPGNDGSESDHSSADESADDKLTSVKRSSSAAQKPRSSLDGQPVQKDATRIEASRASSEIEPNESAAKKAIQVDEPLTEKPSAASSGQAPAYSGSPSTHAPISDAKLAHTLPPPVVEVEEPRPEQKQSPAEKKEPSPTEKGVSSTAPLESKEAPATKPVQDTSARDHKQPITSESKPAAAPATEPMSNKEKAVIDKKTDTAEASDSNQQGTGRNKELPVRPPPKDTEKGLFGLFKKSSSSSGKKHKFWQFWK